MKALRLVNPELGSSLNSSIFSAFTLNDFGDPIH
jgi:hypothetical protein